MLSSLGARSLALTLCITFLVFVAFLGVIGCATEVTEGPTIVTTATIGAGDEVFAKAFADGRSGLLVQGRGAVERLLSDDTDGARHQRFVVRLASGQTLLIAHNVDIASRVEDIQTGDLVAFKGQYEWNEQGGLVHWTHHDPDGSHPAGWIEHGGEIYQ